MKKRIVLETNDIIEMIAKKYGIDTQDVELEVKKNRNDYGDSNFEVNFVFDEKEEEVDYSNYIPTENCWNGYHGIPSDDEYDEEDEYDDEYDDEDE